jgi:hypothetical protein
MLCHSAQRRQIRETTYSGRDRLSRRSAIADPEAGPAAKSLGSVGPDKARKIIYDIARDGASATKPAFA